MHRPVRNPGAMRAANYAASELTWPRCPVFTNFGPTCSQIVLGRNRGRLMGSERPRARRVKETGKKRAVLGKQWSSDWARAGVCGLERRNGFARTKERTNMKTIVTLAIVALFAATAARAEVITKGGATALVKSPTIQTPAPVATAMVCPKCKSEFASVTAPAFKGTTPATATVERHACANCGTKWVTTGHGKAKVETAVHTCGGCKS